MPTKVYSLNNVFHTRMIYIIYVLHLRVCGISDARVNVINEYEYMFFRHLRIYGRVH